MGSSRLDIPTTNTTNSSDNNNDTSTIDASVGGLVWVRRRNGSWWPGQIMSLDEISEESLVSPKSGTPVRLLGRLGASVDWYNLEKSKRVKAFRCTDYAQCIEKAKASAASGNKKAVKYARREDAILHALEIEKAQLAKDQVDSFHSDNSGEDHSISARESPSMSLSEKRDRDATEKSDSKGAVNSDLELEHDSGLDYVPGSNLDLDLDLDSDSDADFKPELSESGTSFEESNHIAALKVQFVQGKRRRTPNDSEDDGTEGIKRMRGLEDLGMNIGDPNTGNGMSNVSPANGSKVSNSSARRKRSQVGNGHEFLKRKNRRRPLTKVMESTAMVPAPVMCDQLTSSSGSPLEGLSDSKISGIEFNDSRRNFCTVLNNNSDSTGGISSENGASLNPIEHGHDTLHTNCKVKKDKDISEIAGIDENDDASHKLFDVPFLAEEKCTPGISPEFVPSTTGMHHAGGSLGRQSSHSSQLEAASLKVEKLDVCGSTIAEAVPANIICERMEKGTSKWQLKGKRNSRQIGKTRKQDSRKYMDMDEEPNNYLAAICHSDRFDQCSDQKVDCDGSSNTLVSNNGNLQIKSKSLVEDEADGIWDWNNSSNRESNVRGITKDASLLPQRLLPYRQSRLTVNSKYQTSDLPARNFCSSTRLYDVKLEVKASYRPHVPLVSLTSKLNGKAIVGHPLEVKVLNDGYCDDMINSSGCDPSNEALLEAPKQSSPLMENSGAVRNSVKQVTARSRFSSRKSRKLRRSGFWSKKIRKLSTLTSGKREDCISVVERPKGPAVSCVPLKLAFSRISEALSGSAQLAHHL